MGFLFTLLAVISPRVGLALLWWSDGRAEFAFDSWVVPTLGFFFLPWTTVAYVLAYSPVVGVSMAGWFVVGVAFLLDLAVWAAIEQGRRESSYTSSTYSHTTAYGPNGSHW